MHKQAKLQISAVCPWPKSIFYDGLNSMYLHLSGLVHHYESSCDDYAFENVDDHSRFHSVACRTGTPGRPALDITREQLETFDELGFTYSQVASILFVSTQTLQKREKRLGCLLHMISIHKSLMMSWMLL